VFNAVNSEFLIFGQAKKQYAPELLKAGLWQHAQAIVVQELFLIAIGVNCICNAMPWLT
jgi:hypothetical protein